MSRSESLSQRRAAMHPRNHNQSNERWARRAADLVNLHCMHERNVIT